jgi:trans-2,3-dihydro-3-hydroxyanthranilate isomerase
MLTYHLLDVFTTRPYTGNPLSVVLGADDLTTAQMQTIAREFNLSETIFVRPPADPAHTASVRIFFPTAEIPFAGHPTIGCACLMAELTHGPGDWDTTVTLEEVAGLVPVTVTRRAGVTRAELTAPVIPHQGTGQADPVLIARALGLPEQAITLPGHSPMVLSGGPSFLFVPVCDLAALAAARPIEPHWSQAMQLSGVNSMQLYAPGTDSNWRTRNFSPTAGVPEDPATGSATAIFAEALRRAGALTDGTTTLQIQQGVEMGRPSELMLTVLMTGGHLTAVRVAGAAVRIAEGRIAPPLEQG